MRGGSTSVVANASRLALEWRKLLSTKSAKNAAFCALSGDMLSQFPKRARACSGSSSSASYETTKSSSEALCNICCQCTWVSVSDWAWEKSFRFARLAATSNGLRATKHNLTGQSAALATACQKGSSRQTRGSLMASCGLLASFVFRSDTPDAIWSASQTTALPSATGGISQAAPLASRIRLLSATTSRSSKKPLGLSVLAAIKLSPRPKPNSSNALVIRLVPLRCMPQIKRSRVSVTAQNSPEERGWGRGL